MYLKIVNNNIIYPYTLSDLAAENKNTSFPEHMSEASLAEFSVFIVHNEIEPDYDRNTQNIVNKSIPEFIDNKWVLGWDIIDKSSEEIAAYDQGVIDFIKSERNKRLFETDWMALSDNTLTTEWATYRQALRDVPQQPGFPYSITWPTMPS